MFIFTIGRNFPLSSLCEVWCKPVDTPGIAKYSSHSPSQGDTSDRKKHRRRKWRSGRQARRARELKKFYLLGLLMQHWCVANQMLSRTTYYPIDLIFWQSLKLGSLFNMPKTYYVACFRMDLLLFTIPGL
jgi:hypothetical protein